MTGTLFCLSDCNDGSLVLRAALIVSLETDLGDLFPALQKWVGGGECQIPLQYPLIHSACFTQMPGPCQALCLEVEIQKLALSGPAV